MDWRLFIKPQENTKRNDADVGIKILLLSGGIAGTLFFFVKLYNKYFTRRRTFFDLSQNMINRQKQLYGKVVKVGDGDNFRFFHMPGGIFLGWKWLRNPKIKKDFIKNETILIRLCGIDAPEMAHFGNPEQPYAREAHQWLTKYILNKYVTITVFSLDQYKRIVARAEIRNFFRKKDVSSEMIKQGLALVYEGKTDCQFGNKEEHYRKLELKAKKKKKGLWSQGKKLVTPGEYKKKYGKVNIK